MKKQRFRCPVCGLETKSFSTCRTHYVLKHDERPSVAAKAVSAENQDITVQKDQNMQEVHDESGRSDTGREPSPALARLLERARAAESVAGQAADIAAAAASSGRPGQEGGDAGGINEILDRILARERAREAERAERESDFARRLREALDGI